MLNRIPESDASMDARGGATSDVLVVGAGAVGLLLSLALARRGLSVILLEKRSRRDAGSRAIGISSPSLGLLEAEGILGPFAAEGVVVRGAVVSDGRRQLGRLDFASFEGRFPYVLSLPQARTEAILEDLALRESALRYRPGVEVVGIASLDGGASGLQSAVVRAEDETGSRLSFFARLVVACDGKRGILGPEAGLSAASRPYPDHFLMGDFVDETSWDNDARLFFTPRGSVESFPLPGGMRRWVLSCEAGREADGGAWLAEETRARTGIALASSALRFESAFGVERRIPRRWARGRLVLAGDAAHLMSPIVGQNMNTGFADALWLARAIAELFGARAGGDPLENPNPDFWAIERLGREYTRFRRPPSKAAARRAWAMMRLGTARGRLVSGLRSPLVSAALSGPTARTLAGIFTMQSISGGPE
ncbi:MAG TPA: NAD(P)/FAD-dependent oxidoreductase [Rectinemataceae bacterium]|nr:NAD(P)/FAD-dependent oxidoreductase [Rectinemataceae bacterium]